MSKDIIKAWINDETDKVQRTKEYIADFGKYEVHEYSHEEGGVLQVPNRLNETGRFASVSKKKLKHEEGLTRAMFNSRVLRLTPCDASNDDSRSHIHRVISFEAPLRRTKQQEDIASRSMACDLVTVASNKFRITAVEVKQTKGAHTNLDYGLVEAWLYAQALARLVNDDKSGNGMSRYDHLRSEIIGCFRDYKVATKNSVSQKAKRCGVEFALAGPESYFQEQFDNNQKLMTPDKVDSLLTQLCSVGKPALPKPKFAGFWVLPDRDGRDSLIRSNRIFMPDMGKGKGKHKKLDNMVHIPTLENNELVLCPDVDSLMERVTR